MPEYTRFPDAAIARPPASALEQSAYNEMVQAGGEFGLAYLNIGDADAAIVAAAATQLGIRARRLAPATVRPDAEARKWFWCAWAAGGIVAMLAGFLIAGVSDGTLRGVAGIVVGVILLAAGSIWVLLIVKWRAGFAAKRQLQVTWLTQVGLVAVCAAVTERRHPHRETSES